MARPAQRTAREPPPGPRPPRAVPSARRDPEGPSTVNHAATRARLRDILAGDACVAMASIYDPLSARIAGRLGCAAGLMGGSTASLAVLGAPDLIVITLTELAEQVRRCTRASDVPLVVDGDHGYGNALNAMRTVGELDAAGAAAVSIEDTLLPRAFAAGDAPQLVPLDEGVAKLEAAVAARGRDGPAILGRTSAASLTGIEDAIARFTAYESAGVDALMIPGLKARDDLDRIAAATRLPLVVGGVPAALADPAWLAARRVRLWSGGHQSVNVAIQALHDAMRAVHEGTHPSRLPGIAAKETIDALTAADDYAAHTRHFVARRRP
ncbi:MAG: oxaloacetate decarboxylase [Betaproteobacteria bacterium]|nr:MAG: oxaloacetate decarboxylase [Betaproteobacteria bacterium]